jgi:flagellar basal body-associated protein FliL
MSNQDKQETEKSDNRMMWIVSAVIILILVGGMGINYLMHGTQTLPLPQ